ncbi:Virginiamycin B lyase [Dyadobacter sp. CECT 9275]|uniref:Virginiamycin B lyase n=1 Tax=Dyadobacter helix TaxID=2822344 RepID=A0A916JG43_9BACT|nr:ScyD/ScyE family protein [Dyadobacter sp. CECT 9275]CAG5008240.1 Virginiamycin B lyase [Dyadobacter sp. CECT 9275]
MKTSVLLRISLLFVLFSISCKDDDQEVIQEPDKLTATDFASQLAAPLGITKGANNNLWVTEMGTGNNDGKVSMITPEGKVYPAITEFTSVISPEEGTPSGLTHLTYKDGSLYILHGVDGKLYKADVSSFKAGDAPVKASTLVGEEIGKFVLAHNFTVDKDETNLFNLTWGTDGDLFITDAAANAVIRRKSDGTLSIFAEIPPFTNPGQVGGPMIDFVPTGIAYDGSKFFVTSLTGFPFIEGKASVQQLDNTGKLSVYKEGYTALVDVVLTPGNKPLVLQFAKFVLPDGFAPNSGKISNEGGTLMIDGLMMPTDIERVGDKTYYAVSMALGKVTKLTY